MLNYVNTVLVSNLSTGSVLTAAPTAAAALNTPSVDAGKFIIMNCDPGVASTKLYEVTSSNADSIQTIKIGIVTKKNAVLRKPNGTVEYTPIVKWSNEIKAADIKSYNYLSYAADTEDSITIDFSSLSAATLAEFAKGGKRIIVRLTFKDMPHRYRKWTESYEYVTEAGDTKATIAVNIGNMINKEWKRARVSANTATANKVILTALPYDDDDNVDSLNWANKVRFNANLYWTDPAAEGWEANNKHYPAGVTIVKTPGNRYAASAKLVRDREAWGMGYQGILNRGEGTWPIIKPDMETQLDKHYNAITLEFENMYRAADDIQRKTKQVVEIYAVDTDEIKAVLDVFVNGSISNVTPVTLTPNFEFPISAGELSGKTITASSPVTMEDLVNGLIMIVDNGDDCRVISMDGNYKITDGSDAFNTVSISSDGLTITFGSLSYGGPTFASFTFNA